MHQPLTRLLNVSHYLTAPAPPHRPKPQQHAPMATPKAKRHTKVAADPYRFTHLRPAPVASQPRATRGRPADDASQTAQRILAVAARAKGERYDRAAWIDGPDRQEPKPITGKQLLRVARRLGVAT